MNERIKELAEQAGFITDPLGNLFGGDDIDRFAELIVRECVHLIAVRKDEAIDNEWNVDETCSMIESDIIEHFGVDE